MAYVVSVTWTAKEGEADAVAAALERLREPAAAAQAPPLCDPNDEDIPSLTIGDVDGDNVGDRVVGLPGQGTVVVRGSRGRHQTLRAAPGDRLGSAVALGDIDGDACSDVVAGAPEQGGHGAVLIFRGSPDGVATTPTVLAGDVAGGRFGAAVALHDRPGAAADLWVGAPGASAVYRYRLAAGAATLAGVVTRPAAAGAGRFGVVLAPLERGALVGVPGEDVAGRKDAGAVVRLASGAGGAPVAAQRVTLPRARKGDRFGTAVATWVFGYGGIAGAPGRDLAGKRDAGVAAVLDAGRRGAVALGDRVAQGVGGVPGRIEHGDRFGAAVTSGRSFLCGEATSYAIGAPGDDVDRVRDAGSVTIVEDERGCDPRALWRGHGLVGTPRRGERLGAALGVVRERDDWEEDAAEDLLALAPGAASVLTRPGGVGPGRPGAFSLPVGAAVIAAPASGNALD